MLHAKADERAATRDHEPWAIALAAWFETLTLWARLTAAMAVVVVLTAAVRSPGLAAALIAAPGGAVLAGMLARAMIRPSLAQTEPARRVATPHPAGAGAGDVTTEALAGIPAEQLFRLAVEALPGGMILTDRTGIIVMLNTEVERQFGYERDELIGRSVDILVPAASRAQHVHRRADFMLNPASRRMGSGRDLFGLRKDGSELPVEVALNPITTRNGVLVLCVIADISERKRAESRKDEFVTTVSHELRTPLTSIAGSLGLLAGSAAGKLPDTAMRLLTIAHKNSQRLVRLINDILEIEKIESGDVAFVLKRVAVRALVEQAIEGSRAHGESLGVTVRLDPFATDADVHADPDRLTQVIANLLSNAIKFLPPGTEVLVSIDAPADRIHVAVRDHGPGIPPDFKARVYQKFAQADADARQKGGTGLGLSIVKGIVTRLAARRDLTTRPTAARFSTSSCRRGRMRRIPGPLVGWRRRWRMGDKAMTAVAKNLEPEPADRSWCTGAAASVRILYVDDEPDIREVVEISLGLDPAFVVRSCASGAEALAATDDWTPDLILLDVIMPEMDGPTTFARLGARPRTTGVPVVFMTARAQASELQRLLALGACGVIAKPFDPMTLAALVRRYAPAAETRLAALRDTFLARARADAAVLAELRRALVEAPDLTKMRGKAGTGVLDRIESIAHNLAEAAGIYGFPGISLDAGALEDAAGAPNPETAVIERELDDLVAGIQRESVPMAAA